MTGIAAYGNAITNATIEVLPEYFGGGVNPLRDGYKGVFETLVKDPLKNVAGEV